MTLENILILLSTRVLRSDSPSRWGPTPFREIYALPPTRPQGNPAVGRARARYSVEPNLLCVFYLPTCVNQ
jgi:hypothetical protein